MNEIPNGAAGGCPICGRDPWAAYFSGDTNFERAFEPCEHERAALQAEEDAGARDLLIEEYDLGESAPGCRLEAYVGAWRRKGRDRVVMCLQPYLTDVERRAREIEAHGYYRHSHGFLWGVFGGRRQSDKNGEGVFLFSPTRGWSPPAYTVAAIAAVVEELEPEWVAAVAEARRYADDLGVVAAWCELPLGVVMGCVRAMHAEVSGDRPAE
jgi:hypothetical protein